MRILALDAALGAPFAALVNDAEIGAVRVVGHVNELPDAIAALAPEGIAAIAVTVGPGSFTGLRASLALAHGLSLGWQVPLVPVTVAEALGEALPHLGSRRLWVAIDSRRGRLFLDRGHGMAAMAPEDLPMPEGKVALAGDAAPLIAAWLAGRGVDVLLTDARRPRAQDLARGAARRLAGELPPLAALPLYVDPPEARLPSTTRAPPL